MAEAELSVKRIAAKHGRHVPLSVKSDVLGFGGRRTQSVRDSLARMQLPFTDDVKYCSPHRLDEFDVHFVVLAPDVDAAGNAIAVPTATNSVTDPNSGQVLSGADVFRREVDILNEFFVRFDRSLVSTRTARGEQRLRFRYKSHHYLEDVRHTGNVLLDYGRQDDYAELTRYGDVNSVGYYGVVWRDRLWACTDRRLVDPLAINVFVIDRMDPDTATGTVVDKRTSGGSHGRHADGSDYFRPYIQLDWVRILHYDQAEEHEMGHVFGLRHVADPNVPAGGNSNIMQGSGAHGPGYPPSENGKRNQGFRIVRHEENHFNEDFDQVAAIVEMAWKHQKYWGEVYRARWPRP